MRHRWYLISLLVLALVAGACSGDDDDTSAPETERDEPELTEPGDLDIPTTTEATLDIPTTTLPMHEIDDSVADLNACLQVAPTLIETAVVTETETQLNEAADSEWDLVVASGDAATLTFDGLGTVVVYANPLATNEPVAVAFAPCYRPLDPASLTVFRSTDEAAKAELLPPVVGYEFTDGFLDGPTVLVPTPEG